jgi:predicted  nucleic acid-binding Zn-ribbon protein
VADTRMTLRQAATVLDVSESAIRKRVERGTLRSDKGPDGRRYVYLDTVADTMADEVADTSATHERDALMSELRAHNDTLQEQLKAERQGHAEARRLLAAALERIPPQLEAPSEARESDVRPGPTGELGELREELDTERTRRERAESTLREGMAEEQRRREKAERERDDLRQELYALRDSPEASEAADEHLGRGAPHPDAPGAQETARRPWWRRMFGR